MTINVFFIYAFFLESIRALKYDCVLNQVVSPEPVIQNFSVMTRKCHITTWLKWLIERTFFDNIKAIAVIKIIILILIWRICSKNSIKLRVRRIYH